MITAQFFADSNFDPKKKLDALFLPLIQFHPGIASPMSWWTSHMFVGWGQGVSRSRWIHITPGPVRFPVVRRPRHRRLLEKCLKSPYFYGQFLGVEKWWFMVIYGELWRINGDFLGRKKLEKCCSSSQFCLELPALSVALRLNFIQLQVLIQLSWRLCFRWLSWRRGRLGCHAMFTDRTYRHAKWIQMINGQISHFLPSFGLVRSVILLVNSLDFPVFTSNCCWYHISAAPWTFDQYFGCLNPLFFKGL